MSTIFELSVTTQGPLYPPSEIMNKDGNFIVIGRIPQEGGALPWAAAIVSADTKAPAFGELGVHDILHWIDLDHPAEMANLELYTLPLPLPVNNYRMLFSPEQRPQALDEQRPSFPLHKAPVPDFLEEHGRRNLPPITLGQWLKASGTLHIQVAEDGRSALFELDCKHLVPDSVYTVMSLREHDLDAISPTRPGPLGVPNIFVTDKHGNASYWARLPNPFPDPTLENSNRIINIVVLYMSSSMSYGGAIGWYGLGGDIHAQLKLQSPSFSSLLTHT
ncbi:MAG: hypothetical protein NT086_11415 [Proteobacteria bacterium]|nr:hypothetical protein [Pseudomonadota bacterium]